MVSLKYDVFNIHLPLKIAIISSTKVVVCRECYVNLTSKRSALKFNFGVIKESTAGSVFNVRIENNYPNANRYGT